jgi:hypothetical protein
MTQRKAVISLRLGGADCDGSRKLNVAAQRFTLADLPRVSPPDRQTTWGRAHGYLVAMRTSRAGARP